MAKILDGKKLSEKIADNLKKEIVSLNKALVLGIVLVGENPASKIYIEQKKKFGKQIGVNVEIFKYRETISTRKLREEVGKISQKKRISGVIVQLPLPEHINKQYILNAISPKKDVDVLTRELAGRLYLGTSQILPPTTTSILKLLEKYKLEIKGKNVTVVGFGKLVGQPISTVLAQRGATITIVNEFTKDKKYFLKNADIVISGVGKANIINKKMLKRGVAVIDSGTTYVNNKLVGDINEDVKKIAGYITPVPGGVGPMTVAMLFSNLIELYKK